MWPFKQKTLCERRGHSWNEMGGFDDGHGGTIMVPLDGTSCLHCTAKYQAPPRPEPKVSDKIRALQDLLTNYDQMRGLEKTYPTYGHWGTYRMHLDHKRTLDDEIQELWDSL
jgi:hypothetical protein